MILNRISSLLWFFITFLPSQMICSDFSNFTLVFFEHGRTPCSLSTVKGPEIYPQDTCSVNCYSVDSVGQDLVQVYDYMHSQKSDIEYNKLVPTDLQNGQDANTAASKVADKSLQYWWDNSGAKNSSLGQSVTNVENNMKKEVDLGGADPGAKKQKLDFAVDAFQTQAKLKYEGYGNAEMIYQARDASVAVQMVEKVGKSQDLIFGVRSSDNSSQVTYKFSW